ncbi:YneF family protein [Xylanibacillus composti]|uniref:YneF family protein n=1 Tax=Xylanibacillus composti TaxID=1572762 RepID=A0A8J4H3X5_9BACL|nr:YneF family protein [Xylanibacillus composti]MDT9725854.1 YneF family protein [Xylanibacillus composti]GIQ69190.1 hypothetical protein XYCOK13_20140 [Xylanibacillus composti]
MWTTVIVSVITLIVGAVAGFFIGTMYLRKQIEKMQSDPKMLQQMARQMGYNVNKQQLNKMQQAMKHQKFPRR